MVHQFFYDPSHQYLDANNAEITKAFLQNFSSNVQGFAFGPSRSVMPDMIDLIADRFPHLHSIDLSFCQIDMNVLDILAKRFPQLESLNLCSTKITNAFLDAIANGWPHLQRLAINSCQNLTEENVLKFCREHPRCEVTWGPFSL